ncbi:MAG: 3'(2'),5'-bisphosphate nucleotidase CysQ [Candidatus Diapherotrites archaeon]
MNWENELEIAKLLARKAGREIIEVYFSEDRIRPEFKSNHTPVTRADVQANKIILEGLQKFFPEDGVVSEELEKVEGGRTWYVDPVDGTKGFVSRSDHFAVHIGLVEQRSPVLGVVFKPATGELYYGVKGAGAFKETPSGKIIPLKIDMLIPDRNILIAGMNFSEYKLGREMLGAIKPSNMFRSGSEGLRILKLVENIADLHLSHTTFSTWDVCAPHAILESAGGFLEYYDGSPVEYFGQGEMGKHLIAARSKIGLCSAQAKLKPVLEKVKSGPGENL